MSEATKPEMQLVPQDTNFEHPFERVLSGHIAVVIDKFQYGGRIVIPEGAKRKPTKGKVIAVADDVKDVKIGDRVLYSQFAGYLLIFDGMPAMRMIGREELLAILKQDAPELIAEGS